MMIPCSWRERERVTTRKEISRKREIVTGKR